MIDWVQVIAQLGFPSGIALMLIYIFSKQYKSTIDFIQNRLTQIVENNTKALESLTLIVNEMRHEFQQSQKELENILKRNQEVLLEIKSQLNRKNSS